MKMSDVNRVEQDGDADGLEVDEQDLKEVEQEMIARELQATENQIQELEKIEEKDGSNSDGLLALSSEDLAARGIHVKNVMEFTATLELSAPRDVSKMYNFSGLKSNLPRDDINLQFCRGQLKLKKDMLVEMMNQSKRKKSLLDPQTLLLLKTQEESHLVAEKTDFWRRAAIVHLKEQRPQAEKNPEWLAEYKKDRMDILQKEQKTFWKQVEDGKLKPQQKKSSTTAPPKQIVSQEKISTDQNKGKRIKLEEKWQLSLSDDSWYRAPQFHPEVNHARRTDVEILCEIIYGHGERYDDGTAAIGFTWLFKMLNRANTVGVLIKAKKYGLVYFDGEIVFASVRTEDDDEFVVLQRPIGEIRKAFADMRGRHADLFDLDRKRRPTLVLPTNDTNNNDGDDYDESEEESEC